MDSDYNDFYLPQSEVEYTTIEMLVYIERDDFGIEAEVTALFHYNALSREINLSRSLGELPLHGTASHHSEYITGEACQLFYYDDFLKCYVYLGNYPFDREVVLSAEEFQTGAIRLRYRPITPVYSEGDLAGEYEVHDDEPKTDPSKKRVKERTTREVLRLVSKWRQFAEKDKCTLEIASKLVGVPKKTLDDYYSQIRLGEEYGFNFEQHENDGIGVLRKFVREKREKKKPNVKILEKYIDYKKEHDD